MKTSQPFTDREQALLKKLTGARIKDEPVIVSSLSLAHTYYLFRRTGLEIMFTVDTGKIYCATHKLSAFEIEYINENIIGNK